jgi:hypothetical protein
MAQQEAWQVRRSAAELYQRYLFPAMASLWAAELIDRAAPRFGEWVLDARSTIRDAAGRHSRIPRGTRLVIRIESGPTFIIPSAKPFGEEENASFRKAHGGAARTHPR